MTRQKPRLLIELLECRKMFSGTAWFEDSGQQAGQNSFGVLGDLDGDGDLDVFSTCYAVRPFDGQCRENSVWLNDGHGTFHQAWAARATNVLSAALADLDADGDLDVFVGQGSPFGGARNHVLLNDGDGNFTDTGQRLGRGISWHVALADVDADGDVDAVVANRIAPNNVGSQNPSQVWLNDGFGNFEQTDQDLAGKFGFAVALGDLDGDGDPDAYLAGGFTQPADHVLINDGHGNFVDSGQTLGRRYATSVQLGDLDADGDLDAFVANGGFSTFASSQPNEVWINDGNANFINSGQEIGREITTWSALGDLDGDGDLDAFYVNGTIAAAAQSKRIWLNDGKGTFVDSGEKIGVPSWGRSVELGDLDNDGDLDAFVGNLNRKNEIWLNVKPTPGDANRDGIFNSSDLILVFQAGEYEDDVHGNSLWETGDWNCDGEFDTGDLILAFQSGNYVFSARMSRVAAIVDTLFSDHFSDEDIADSIVAMGNPHPTPSEYQVLITRA